MGVGARARACACTRVTVIIQHAKRRRIVLSSAASSAPPHFFDISHEQHGFRKNVTEQNVYFDFLYNFYKKHFLTLRRIQRDIVMNVKTSSCEVPAIRNGFQRNLNFLDIFSEKAQISSLVKIR